MRRRTTAALSGIALSTLLAALTASPASSAPAQVTGLVSYTADAAARALTLELGGTSLVAGDSTAGVDSTPTAAGTGTGALLPILTGAASAESPAGGTNVFVPETCSPLVINDASLPIGAATACGSASAETEGDPSATGGGFVEDLVVEVQGTPLDEPLTQILGDEGAGQLLDALVPITGPLADAGLDVNSLLSEIIDQLVDGTPAVSITLGAAESASVVTADAVTSAASAAGGEISVLGLVNVIVGPSSATVSVNRTTGAITHSENAAAISVELLGPVLGLLPDELEGPLFDGLDAPLEGTSRTIELLTATQLAALQDAGLFDQNGCLNPGGQFPAPLNTLVCVELADTDYTEDVEGPEVSATGRATAVRLQLLAGIVPDEGILLALSDSTASVAAVLAQAPTPTTTPVTTARSIDEPVLARTGGGGFPPMVVLTLAGIALAGVVATRRAVGAR